MRKEITVALAGKPNCGKSTLFNELTGLNQKTGNFPGVTVERKTGIIETGEETIRLIDLPGAYSIFPRSEDERITTKVLTDPSDKDYPDFVVLVADATNLRNCLLLALQVIDLGHKAILALNMSDLLPGKGIEIQSEILSDFLGIPVVTISGLKGQGIKALKSQIQQISSQATPERFFRPGEKLSLILPQIISAFGNGKPFESYVKWASGQKAVKAISIQPESDEGEALIIGETLDKYSLIDEVLAKTVKRKPLFRKALTQKIDRWVLHPFWGYLIFIMILACMFQALFAWAEYPMGWIDSSFGHLGKWIQDTLPDAWYSRLLVEGVLSGISGILVFIPQIAFLFLFITLLEDSGYMSRVVFLMDRIMRHFGMNGKSVIPLIGGMACAVPSIMMTRGIANTRERLITILTLPLMSCSARLPVYALLVSLFVPNEQVGGFLNLQGLVMLGMYFLGFIMVLIVGFVIRFILKKVPESVFILEMPDYRLPRTNNVLITIFNKCKAFVEGAGKLILFISVILWFLVSFGPEIQQERSDWSTVKLISDPEELSVSYAGHLGRQLEPLIQPLGYDWKIGICLITSFAAREVFVGTLASIYRVHAEEGNIQALKEALLKEKRPDGSLQYSPASALSLMFFFAFAMQCMSTLAVVKRESGWKWAIIMVIYMNTLAYLSAWLVYHIFR